MFIKNRDRWNKQIKKICSRLRKKIIPLEKKSTLSYQYISKKINSNSL